MEWWIVGKTSWNSVPNSFGRGCLQLAVRRVQLDIQSIRPQIAVGQISIGISFAEFISAALRNRRNPCPFFPRHSSMASWIFLTPVSPRVSTRCNSCFRKLVHPTKSEKGVKSVAQAQTQRQPSFCALRERATSIAGAGPMAAPRQK